MTTGGEPLFLQSLNDTQRRAVLHDSGPLAVLAGPGTGKTHVIIHRIARAIAPREQGGLGASPESVLALAFTIKSAEELRQRLAAMCVRMGLGVGAAERIRAMTVHSFGSSVVRRFADRLGLPTEFTVMDSAQQRRMLRAIVWEHDLFRSLAAAGRETVLDEAFRFLSACRDDSLTPECCAKWVERRRAMIAQGLDPCVNGADGQPTRIDEERAAALLAELPRHEDLSRLYALYDAQCIAEGKLTLDDFVTLPVRLLRTDADVRAILRDEFRHIVVDEFQDWNMSQIELLKLLAPVSRASGAPSDVCVVGDDDQAIYGFRGADDRAFARFAEHYQNSTTVALTLNYRSARVIVETANRVIEKAGSRFAPDKVIEPGRPGDAQFAGARIEGVEYDKKQGETDGAIIAAMLLHDRAHPGENAPPRRWNHYAVIARSGTHLDQIGAELEVHNIPVARRESAGVLDDEFVQDLLAWIEVLTDPHATPGASPRRILFRPPVGMALDDIIRYEREHRLLVEAGEPRGYLDWLIVAHATDPVVGRVREVYDELRARVAQDAADVAVDAICRAAIFPAMDLLDKPTRLRSGTRLARYVAFVRGKQPNLDAPGDLREWRSYFDDLDEGERSRLSDSGEARLSASPGDANGEKDAVQLLTAHGSKGLEFDTVFLPRVRPRAGQYPSAGVNDRAPLEPDLMARGISDRSDEERRLFYVACTRAERRLVLLAEHKKDKKTSSASGDYFLELTHDPDDATRVPVVSGGDLLRDAGVEVLPPSSADEGAVGGTLLDRAERSFRDEASELLHRASSARVDDQTLREIEEGLARTARRMAVVGKIRASGLEPDAAASLASGDERLHRLIERLRTQSDSESRMAPMPPPLWLSYSKLEDFRRCPRCFYVKYGLKLDEPRTTELSMGQLAHLALDRFYRERQAAEADGRFPPGAARLLEIGEHAFLQSEARDSPGGKQIREQLLAQLALTMEKLHDDRDHVLHTELNIRMPFRLQSDPPDARPHFFTAKIDRVDNARAPGGGFRIIDYKTGRATKSKLEIGKSDLQMSLYALAISWWSDAGMPSAPGALSEDDAPLFATSTGEAVRLSDIEPAPGVAEYWVLSSGQRGVIGFDALKLDKVVGIVEDLAAKMLAGEYEKGSDCKGLCDYLGR